ncbi:MAG: hypothetical protein H0V93_08490, partial [Euzebyales bacterium]|nr:hypothetical protein [Euzebyales bacterium]
MATNPRVTGGDWREIDAVFKPVFDDLARSARELARLDDPVDAECWISELLAMYHG